MNGRGHRDGEKGSSLGHLGLYEADLNPNSARWAERVFFRKGRRNLAVFQP